MTNGDDFNRAAENARLLTKLSIISAVGALILLVTTVTAGFSRGGDTLQLAFIPYVFALLFAAASMIYGILRTSTANEDEEKKLLEKRMESRALNVEEDVRFTAGRSFANYRRFAPYVLTVIAMLLMGFLLWQTVSTWNAQAELAAIAKERGTEINTGMKGSPIHTALLSAVLMMVSVFAGAFMVGQSRISDFRWLRPVGAWLIAGFAAMLLVTVSAICYANNLVGVDKVCGKILFWAFIVLGAEFAVNFIIEFYRPRTIAEVRPVFESQLLSLFTEPGGVMRNIASALDYQFGFKVSGTWLYGFVERAFFPLILLWALLFWGFTTIHEVGPNQVGIRERFGRISENRLLSPGIYWTLPYPFGSVRRFSCTELKTVNIGESEKNAETRGAAPVVLWTNQHGGADNPFVVAVDSGEIAKDGNADVPRESVSISLVNMSIPIEYHIRNSFEDVYNYAYGNVDPVRVLRMIGEQAATEYMSRITIDELLAQGRSGAEAFLKKRIQQLADANKLGIRIVRVGIMDAHPPVEKVAPKYQEEIASRIKVKTMKVKAETMRQRLEIQSEREAYRIAREAESAQESTDMVSKADAERFETQLKLYRAMPAMYKLNTWLTMLEKETPRLRKYILGPGMSDEVYQLNLEEREKIDLVDLDDIKKADKSQK